MSLNAGLGTLNTYGGNVVDLIKGITNNSINQIHLGRFKTVSDKKQEIIDKYAPDTKSVLQGKKLPSLNGMIQPNSLKTISFKPVKTKEVTASVSPKSISKRDRRNNQSLTSSRMNQEDKSGGTPASFAIGNLTNRHSKMQIDSHGASRLSINKT